MNFVTVVSVIVVVLATVHAVCKDDDGYAEDCVMYKEFCDYDTVTWPDGTVLHTKCTKTCGKCSDTSSDKSSHWFTNKGSNEKCEDEHYACEDYDREYCESGTWEDGTFFWKRCRKTCNKCDDKSSDEKDERDWSGDWSAEGGSDKDCVDKYPNCGSYDRNFCHSGSWDDGATVFWKYCMVSCGCCDGSCAREQGTLDAVCGGETAWGPSADYFKEDILNKHNELRALHKNTPSMTWDYTLQSYAQRHCDELAAANRNLWHSQSRDRGGSGENLAWRDEGNEKVCNKVGSQSTQDWYDEIEYYDYSTGDRKRGASEAVGHFTQLIWSDSTKLGCAYSVDSYDTTTYVCCNYNPPGNWRGENKSKVKALKSSWRRKQRDLPPYWPF